jgi:homoserine acetyltransferase
MKTAFPKYNYDDMVDAQYRLVSEGLGIKQLRLVIGNSMATLLAINAADDERNPPETGVTDAAMKRIKNGKLYLIPASPETRGHLTTGNAKFYAKQLQELLQTAPRRTM